MTDPPFDVGFGRPPVHSRFQKGQSGNPGGKPGAKRVVRRNFGAALVEALNADVEALRQSHPTNALETLARQMVLDAVEGRPSAQRMVLSTLDQDDGAATEPAPLRDCRQIPDEEYEELEGRFDAAIETGSGEELLAVVRELRDRSKFPQSGNP